MTTFALTFPPEFPAHHFTPRNTEIHHRMRLELFVVWNTLRFMAHHGWEIHSVNDGEEWVRAEGEPDERQRKTLDDVFAVDEARVRFIKDDRRVMAYFVLGNDGYDVLADCSVDCPLADIDGEDWCTEAAKLAFAQAMTSTARVATWRRAMDASERVADIHQYDALLTELFPT
jgi:hypothetical protein